MAEALNIDEQPSGGDDGIMDFEIDTWDERKDISNCSCGILSDGIPVRKLFIRNLPRHTRVGDLRNIFGDFGHVIKAYIAKDRYGLSRGHGFVTFSSCDSAHRALHCHPSVYVLHGRRFIVQPAYSWQQPDGRSLRRSEAMETVKPVSSQDNVENCEEAGCSSSMEAVAEESQVELVDQNCAVHMLNNDCLYHIFSFLSRTERIKIERVCKRWRTVSQGMWKSIQSVDFSELISQKKYGARKTICALAGVLSRCGENLTNLNLGSPSLLFNWKALDIIGNHCHQLHNLDLSGVPLSVPGLKKIAPLCSNLEHLKLNSCNGAHDRVLYNFFSKCNKLQFLSLAYNNHLTGRSLLGLSPSNLKVLILDECNNLQPKFVMQALRRLHNLNTLSIDACVNLGSRDVTQIIKSVPKIQKLSVAKFFPLIGTSSLTTIGSLLDLEDLNLEMNPAVNDDVLKAISENCKKLATLNISGCSQFSDYNSCTVTDVGMKCLKKLPLLENLKISYLGGVSNESLEAVADIYNLKELECRGCPSFSDAGCTRVLNCCSKLEFFDFSGCDNVSNVTLDCAIEAVRNRDGNLLELVVGGTKITENYLQEPVPLLKLNYKITCVNHLRPDFVDDIFFPTSYDDDFSEEYFSSDTDDDDDDYISLWNDLNFEDMQDVPEHLMLCQLLSAIVYDDSEYEDY